MRKRVVLNKPGTAQIGAPLMIQKELLNMQKDSTVKFRSISQCPGIPIRFDNLFQSNWYHQKTLFPEQICFTAENFKLAKFFFKAENNSKNETCTV